MIRLALLIVAGCLALAGCSPTVDHRGYVVPKRALEALADGAATRAQVLEALGTPSSTTAFDDNTWYYFGETVQRVSFYDPELVERQILIVRFDDAGLVSNIETRDASNGNVVTLVGRETPTAGHSLTAIEQILGNIGRFNRPRGDL